jgi:CRP/FNR family cyclic AMP-dependent transcriptional regulator
MPQRGRLRGFRRKTRDAKIELLQGVPLFSACSKRDLTRIASLVDEIDWPEGRVLMRQGDSGNQCFIIAEGEVKATVRGRRGVTLGPGAVLGEMALIDHGPRSATVTAETDLHLLVLGSREFFSLLDDVPGVGQRIMRSLAERVRAAERTKPQH